MAISRYIPVILVLSAFFCPLFSQDGSTAGTFMQETPTLHCLAVRWEVKGDQNKNAVIEVQYRKKGTGEWKQGFPLLRTFGRNLSGEHQVAGGWMFAGSIVNCEPDTLYEVKCSLKDPDGGNAEKTVEMKTWAEPKAPANMRVMHVAPGDGGGTGSKSDPIKGLPETQKHAQPGTLFLIHKGTYKPFGIARSGQLGKPIIYRAAG